MPQQQRTAGAVTFLANTTALYDPARSTATNRVATLNTGNVAAAAYLGYANYEVRAAKGQVLHAARTKIRCTSRTTSRVTNRLTVEPGPALAVHPYP